MEKRNFRPGRPAGVTAVNVALGTEPRAVFGIPIAAALLAYLFRPRVREFFREG